MGESQRDTENQREKSKQKFVESCVHLLDSTCQRFSLPIRALGQELYDLVIDDLQLVEYDYFDLEYVNKDGHTFWLDHLKPLQKQHTAHKDYVYSFVVKFYTPHPNLLEDEFTRYLFALQIRKDLQLGRLPCSDNTAALLYAFIVQSQIGDYLEDLYADHTYLSNLSFLPVTTVNTEFLKKVMECHRNLVGQSPADADFNLLDTARKVELYGIRMHPAKDAAGFKVNLSVSHAGVLVYQGNARINTFSWARVRKLSFKRKRFFVKLHSDDYDIAEFVFESRDECKSFWKRCIEHHAFFRCHAVRQKADRRGRMVPKGSSFRYTGRTQKQLVEYVRENYIKLNHVERSSSSGRAMSTPLPYLSLNKSVINQNSYTHIGSGVQSDIGPSTEVKLRERPMTYPTQRTLLTDTQLSPYASQPFAIAIPLLPSSGCQTVQGSTGLTVRQRRSTSLANDSDSQNTLPRAAYLLANWTNASSGSCTMNSSTSAGSPDFANSPTGSPIRQQQMTVSDPSYATHLILPSQLKLQDIAIRPLSISTSPNIASSQTNYLAPVPIVVSGTMQTSLSSPRPVSATVLPNDPYAGMHASMVEVAHDRNTLTHRAPNLPVVALGVPASGGHPVTGHANIPVAVTCKNVQTIAVRQPLFIDPARFQNPSQMRFPGAYTVLAAPPGSNPITEGRIVYIDRTTGRPYLPVFAAGGHVLTGQATSELIQPAAVSNSFPVGAIASSVYSAPLSSSPNTTTMFNENSANISSSVNSPCRLDAQIPTSTLSESLVVNGVSIRPRRLGPPPPAPERRDSMLHRPSPTPSQRSSIVAEFSFFGEATVANRKSSASVGFGLVADDASDSSQHSSKISHPVAIGLITKPGGINSASCLSLAARGRSALSTRSLCINTADDSDEITDNDVDVESRYHSDAETRPVELDDTDRRSVRSQGGNQRSRSTSFRRRSRHDHRDHRTMQCSVRCRSAFAGNLEDGAHRRQLRTHPDGARYLVRDMVMTEKTYGRDLAIVCVHFRQEATELAESFGSQTDDRLSSELANRLFALLDPIYSGHRKLLAGLEARLNSWAGANPNDDASVNQSFGATAGAESAMPVCRIGDLLLAHTHLFTAFQQYLTENEQIILAIEREARTRPGVEQTIRRFEAQKICYLPLYVFLLKPMRRLLQYRATLERLMRHYADAHLDAPDCRMAHARLLDLIQSHWDSYRKVENTYKLLEIQRDLIGLSPVAPPSTRVENSRHMLAADRQNLGPLYQFGRQFIREGWLQKLSKKGYQPRMFFLFSDQLIYASRTSRSFLQFKVHGQFPLHDLMVEEAEPAHSFTIFSGNRCFLVAAPSDWQRDRWLEDISRAILAAKTKPATEDVLRPELITNGICKADRDATPDEQSSLLQRTTTSIHVCWHRNCTYSMQDILRANEYETSGYLLRKFKNSYGWQRLWVVFTQNCLFFYKSYRDDNPLASLPLAGYTITTPNADDPIRRDGVIKLHFKNHVYYFRGETQHSFERWLENLSIASGTNRRSNV